MSRNHRTPRRDLEAAIVATERAILDARVSGAPTSLLLSRLADLQEEHARAGGGEGVTPERFSAAMAALPNHSADGGPFDRAAWLTAWVEGSAVWLEGNTGIPRATLVARLRAALTRAG